jgi:hypothetical protein
LQRDYEPAGKDGRKDNLSKAATDPEHDKQTPTSVRQAGAM